MARQKSLVKLKGTLDGITFYQTKDGHLARTKTTVNVERMKHDPKYARTRENMAEFKSAANSAKLLRDSVRPFIAGASDYRVSSRLNQVMSQISKHDTSSFRGLRTPGLGLNAIEGKNLFKSFNFNKEAIMASILFKPWAINTTTGIISINDLNPETDLNAPTGATHFKISGAVEKIDFGSKVYHVQYTNIVNSEIADTVVPVLLTPASMPIGTGITLYFLKIEFFQMVNNVQYSLRNGMFNALSVIEVV